MSATFAMAFTPGPEQKAWDGLMGYPTVLGRARITGTAFEDFFGEDGCGSGSFAITNHAKAPDAFHPHEFSDIRLSNVDVGNGALLKLHGPDPSWRNPSDCGTATFERPDGTTVDLNCDGPNHILLKVRRARRSLLLLALLLLCCWSGKAAVATVCLVVPCLHRIWTGVSLETAVQMGRGQAAAAGAVSFLGYLPEEPAGPS